MDMKVMAHLQALVVVTSALVSLYPFNSLFISVHIQTPIVIKAVEIIKINSEKSTPPINNIRLMKNSIETLQYVINNFSMALFLFLLDHIRIERGTPTIKIEDS
tara:strand:+ start:122 stop:433 length:312 start_codon:yes stop_codon:yes gene_type:complete